MLFSPCLPRAKGKMLSKFIICKEDVLIIFAFSHEDKLNCVFPCLQVHYEDFPVAHLSEDDS